MEETVTSGLTVSSLAGFVTSTLSILTTAWGQLMSFLISHPALLVTVLILPVIGLCFVYLRRLI